MSTEQQISDSDLLVRFGKGDEEAFREILDVLRHRTRYIHQAEHHGAGRRRWLLDHIVVAQVEVIEKRNLVQAPLSPFELV